MCGHVGVLTNKITLDHRKFFEEGLYSDALRGHHGTGMAIVKKDDTIKVVRKAVTALDFLDMNKVSRTLIDHCSTARFLMGHNRRATKGAHINKNTHPFRHGKITMAHNGSLRNQTLLPDHSKFVVDSDNIAYSLDKIGVEETVRNLVGSYSLVWHNSEDNTVNFIRNDERPMSLATVDGGKTILYGSEPKMIEWLAERNDLKIEEITETTIHHLYTFNLDGKEEVFKPRIRKIEPYKAPVSYLPARTDTRSYSDDRNARRDKKLRDMGLRIGDTVEFSITGVDPYSGRGALWGDIEGFMESDPWADVVIFNTHLGTRDIEVNQVWKGSIQGINFAQNPTDPDRLIINAYSLEQVKEVSDDSESKGNTFLGVEIEDAAVCENGCTEVCEECRRDLEEETTPLFRGPRGLVSGKEFDQLTRNGCGWCSGNIFQEDHEEVEWLDNGSCICPQCVADYQAYNMGVPFDMFHISRSKH